MLWILDGHAITKIPLSDLDLEATRKENPRRGGRFLLQIFPVRQLPQMPNRFESSF